MWPHCLRQGGPLGHRKVPGTLATSLELPLAGSVTRVDCHRLPVSGQWEGPTADILLTGHFLGVTVVNCVEVSFSTGNAMGS